MNKFSAFASRLREPSTYAGLAAIGAMLGAPSGALDAVGQVVIGVAGLLAMFLPERGAGK